MVGCWSQLTPRRTVVTSFTPRRSTNAPGYANGSHHHHLHGTAGAPPSACAVVEDNFHNAFEEGDWALALAAPSAAKGGGGGATLSCALSNGDIQVYDQERLHQIATYSNGNGALVTDLVYGRDTSAADGTSSSTSSSVLVATGADGTLTGYDLRQSPSSSGGSGAAAAVRCRIPTGQSALSVSLGFDGCIAAVAASKGRIHFFDLRNAGCSSGGPPAAGSGILGSYVDSHTDDVVSVEFNPSNPSLLLSGGGDGLACLFDTTQPTEESAIKSVVNVGTPLRKAGFCGGGHNATVWCLTGSESASLWDSETAACIQDFGLGLREQLSQSLGGGAGGGANHRQLDYLIDAYWLTDSQELLLSAGNASGDAALFRLLTSQASAFQYQHQQNNTSQQHQQLLQWEPCHWMAGGHRGVVRSTCHLSQSIVVTGGEDARLCEWNRLGHQAHSAAAAAAAAAAGSGTATTISAPTATALNVPSPRGSPRGKVSTSVLPASRGGGPVRRQRNRPSHAPY